MSPSAEPVPAVALLDVSEAVLELLLELALRDADADEVTPPLGTTPGWNTDRISWFREFHRASAAGLDGPAGQKSWAISCDGQLAGSVRLRRPDTEPPEAVAGGAGATADAGAGTGGGVGTGATADAGAGTGGGVGTGATADAGAGAGAGATADAG
ncbi:GNAT family N-acetyltransferase, partial [Arthrobacter sp. ok362]|uniref:GNAT family N-acetyltransferase n=1 Tax=Arthrobacter sp. ok362 TaxID=1761745 RepID=UPI0008885B6E